MTVNDPADPLGGIEPHEIAEVLMQHGVTKAGYAFVSALVSGNLAEAWPMMHTQMRLAWVQLWQHDNRAAMESAGYDLPDMATTLAGLDGPTHPLWEVFARVMLRNLTRWGIGDGYGLGSRPRPVAPNLELLHIHQGPGIIQPGESAQVVPLLMFLEEDRWLAMALGSEKPPVPGYPPMLT